MGLLPRLELTRAPKKDRRRGVETHPFLPRLQLAKTKCGFCGKPYTNPLTHTCTKRIRVKKTKRGAKAKAPAKPRQAAPRPRAHNFRTCRDDDCTRPACEAYREGYELGWDDGMRAAHAAGRTR